MPYASLAAQAQSSCICGHLDLVFMEMFLNLFAFGTKKLFPSQLLDHTWQSFPCPYQIYSPYSQVGFKWHIKWVCIKSLYLVMETVGVYWNPMQYYFRTCIFPFELCQKFMQESHILNYVHIYQIFFKNDSNIRHKSLTTTSSYLSNIFHILYTSLCRGH